jgi:hypothetical protein
MSGAGIVGRWRLLSWSGQAESGETTHPFGEDAVGSLVYTPGGWMSGMLAVRDRPHLPSVDLVGGTESERAAAFSTISPTAASTRSTATPSSTGLP